MRAFLITSVGAPLNGPKLIHQFCDMYEHARHDPNEFQEDEYREFHRLFMKLIDSAKMLKTFNSRKSSPSRTPKKQAKTQSLLDPARLVRPIGGQNDTLNRNINMSLGLGQLDDQELGENEILSIAQYNSEN
jgi:NICE-3 protein